MQNEIWDEGQLVQDQLSTNPAVLNLGVWPCHGHVTESD